MMAIKQNQLSSKWFSQNLKVEQNNFRMTFSLFLVYFLLSIVKIPLYSMHKFVRNFNLIGHNVILHMKLLKMI